MVEKKNSSSVKITKLDAETKASKPSGEREKAKKKQVRKHKVVKQTVAKIEIWSVAKIAFLVYTAFAVLSLLTFWFMWFFAKQLGLVKNLESFLGDSLQLKEFSLVNAKIILGVALLMAAFVVLNTVLTLVAVVIYNIFAGAVGGVEIYSVEEKP